MRELDSYVPPGREAQDFPMEASGQVEDDYQVVRLSIGWGPVSILTFVAILILQIFGNRFGASLGQVIFGTMAMAAAGLILGLIGLKFGHSRDAARAGAFLNGVVLLIIFIVLPVFYQIMRRLA